MPNNETNKLAKTVEEVNEWWCRYVDLCESHALDWVMSEMDTLNRIIKEKKRSPFVNYLLGGSSREHNDWLLQMMIWIQKHQNDAAQYSYDTYRVNDLHYRQVYGGGLTAEEKAERDAYFTE